MMGLLFLPTLPNSPDASTQCRGRDEGDKPIKHFYKIEKLLGEGAFGRVYWVRRRADGQVMALKAINRRYSSKSAIDREIGALRRLSDRGGHPHVCRLFDIHENDQRYYFLSMELIQGGEILEHLIKKGPYSEADAAVFLRQLAEAMCFIHKAGITHADLKCENIMLSSWDENDAKLKVVDFGSALQDDLCRELASDGLGTHAYWAPELFDGARPNPASDMWAVGCILYILVTGSHPFDKGCAFTDKQVNEAIVRTKTDPDFLRGTVFDDRVEELSSSCTGLIAALLEPDPSKRITSEAFLRHPWVQGLTASWETMANSDRKLKTFWQKRFRDRVLESFAQATKHKGKLSEKNLHEIFQSTDLDGNGVLDPEELCLALRKLGFPEEKIQVAAQSLNLDGSGTVNYDIFKAVMYQNFSIGGNSERKLRGSFIFLQARFLTRTYSSYFQQLIWMKMVFLTLTRYEHSFDRLVWTRTQYVKLLLP
jgi:serine/threonine protein kinase